MKRPAEDEYLPYYAMYINLVGSGDIISVLESQIKETASMLRAIPDSRGTYRYAAGKWSINEVLGHLIDSERIFSNRALRFARGDSTPIPGFEQDDYVRSGEFDRHTLAELIAEFEGVRRDTLALFKHMSEEATRRHGKANNAEVSVRALAYITAGHEMHHRRVIAEKYQNAGT